MNPKHLFYFLLTLCLQGTVSCNRKKDPGNIKHTAIQAAIHKDYLPLIIAMDTLLPAASRKVVYREDSLLSLSADKENNPFYYYFKGRRYNLDKKKDSALACYEKMLPASDQNDTGLLKAYSILNYSIGGIEIVKAKWMNRMLAVSRKAEEQQSNIQYLFYDLLARAWYQNENIQKSMEYTELYYKNHPYREHPVVKQRYYDISFLLYARMDDDENMMLYNVKARNLARSIGDSMALARTYDNEAQIYARQGKNDQALESSLKYFNYLKRTHNLNDVAYNNLATSFIRNRQPDSAIRYYQEAIAFKRKEGRLIPSYYKGLIDAYKAKGAYAEALQAAEEAYANEIKNIREIEAVKVAELHEQYEAEKKDRNIMELSTRNQLNEKMIGQQRWMLLSALLLFIAALSILYIIYRQRLLKEKNRLLQSENDRLQIEQKLLQAQLNPHFVFNAIANLQGLIATGDTTTSIRYLSSFSRLLRDVLEQSRKDFIGLDEEIISLHNYLYLQQMRFAGLFEYRIVTEEGLPAESILVPPMLVQPFVENAIEHGFRGIDYKGHLTIQFWIRDKQLVIRIDDNGSGLKDKKNDALKKQSLARIILKERLHVLFRSQGREAAFDIRDKKDMNQRGVYVQITIPEMKD